MEIEFKISNIREILEILNLKKIAEVHYTIVLTIIILRNIPDEQVFDKRENHFNNNGFL